MNTGPEGVSPRQRQLALVRGNHVRAARAALKRRVHAREVAAAEAILRCSR